MSFSRIHQPLDVHLAARPEAIAFRDFDGSSIAYGALNEAVDAMASELSGLGIQAGDRLLILAENCAALVGLVMAASRLNAIAVPVNARMTSHELQRIAPHADPKLTVYLSNVSPDAAAHAAEAGARSWRTALGALEISGPFPDAVPEPVRPGREAVAVILYTTGTTGTPKGVMLTHSNLLFGGETSVRMRKIVSEDLILGVLPMTHVFGLTSMMIASVVAGASLWLFPRFNAATVLEALNSGVTVMPAVPQIHALVMAEADKQGLAQLPTKTLRYVSSGAAPLDPDWKRRAEHFYGCALQNGYGMTETTAGVTLTVNPRGVADVSVGPALPGVELKMRNPGSDGVGEILTRGPHVMPGYFRNPAETAAVFDEEGFLRTGDLGRIDGEGNLHIAGRARELIIRGGFNVYPPEVESALNDHPGVLQCAVVGRTVSGGNEEVLAFCQVRDAAALTEKELHDHAASRLSPYKVPSRIIITNALPAAPTGKILKNKLIETFRQDLD